jgi:hypothetical protein
VRKMARRVQGALWFIKVVGSGGDRPFKSVQGWRSYMARSFEEYQAHACIEHPGTAPPTGDSQKWFPYQAKSINLEKGGRQIHQKNHASRLKLTARTAASLLVPTFRNTKKSHSHKTKVHPTCRQDETGTEPNPSKKNECMMHDVQKKKIDRTRTKELSSPRSSCPYPI